MEKVNLEARNIEVVGVTRELLNYWESINTYIMQRPISPGWLSYFKTCMERGTFREMEIAIAEQSYNGNQRILVNGQTTTRAALETGWTGKAVVKNYESETDKHLLELFSSFDVINKRNTGHIVGGVALGLGIKSCYIILKAMPESILKIENQYTKNGCKTDGTFKPTTKQLFERAGVIKYYIDEIKIITDIFCQQDDGELKLKEGLSKNNFANNAVISSMLYTIQANKEHGDRFWRDVILAENRDNIYAMECREYILTNMGTLNRANRVQLVSIVGTLLRGWNRYMSNADTRFKTVVVKHLPGGTRFAKPVFKYIAEPLSEKL
jgi:hypothetical protein